MTKGDRNGRSRPVGLILIILETPGSTGPRTEDSLLFWKRRAHRFFVLNGFWQPGEPKKVLTGQDNL